MHLAVDQTNRLALAHRSDILNAVNGEHAPAIRPSAELAQRFQSDWSSLDVCQQRSCAGDRQSNRARRADEDRTANLAGSNANTGSAAQVVL